MVLWAVVSRFLPAASLVWMVGALTGLAQALLLSAVVPDLDLLGRMVLCALGVGASLAFPVGALGAVVGGARRLEEDGAWLGLRTLGVGGAALGAPVLSFLSVVMALWLGVAHVGEPLARTALREARVAAAVRVAPVEGRAVQFGPWAAAVEGGVLHFAGEGWLGTAQTWEIQPALTGVVVVLGGGEVRAADGRVRARFTTIELPVALSGTAGRVHASERSTPDLVRHLDVNAALGQDKYERWILWKRTLLPLTLLPLGLAALALGLAPPSRARPVVAIVGAQLLTLWSAVRVADQQIDAVGLMGASLLTGGAAMAWCAWAWLGWRDR